MQELMGIQKTGKNYAMHHFHPKEGFSSFFIGDEETLKVSLSGISYSRQMAAGRNRDN